MHIVHCFYKGHEHLQILVFKLGFGSNPQRYQGKPLWQLETFQNIEFVTVLKLLSLDMAIVISVQGKVYIPVS